MIFSSPSPAHRIGRGVAKQIFVETPKEFFPPSLLSLSSAKRSEEVQFVPSTLGWG